MEQKEWFASWFDTEYYHILYKHRNYDEAEAFVRKVVDFLKLPQASRVLDLACGKGRHSVTLNRLGFDVLGVDLSENSICEARKHEDSGLCFDVHDMRKRIPNETFDAVFNLFTSFGYFDNHEENEEVIRAVRAMLHQGGLFIIDFMNSEKIIQNLVQEETKTVDGITFNIKRWYDGKHIFKNIRFTDKDVEHDYTERVQALKAEDFERMLTSNGFDILATFGDFELNMYDKDQSDRLIIIGAKE